MLCSAADGSKIGAVAEIGGSTNIVSIEGKFSEEISMVGKGQEFTNSFALVADLEKISKVSAKKWSNNAIDFSLLKSTFSDTRSELL